MQNLDTATLTIIISSLLGVIAGLCQAFGKTGIAKALGAISITDIGAALRAIKEWADKRKAAKAKARAEVITKTMASLLVLLLIGCDFIKSPATWDAAEKACVLALTVRPEVVAEAKARQLTGQEWASAICQISDIVESFLLEADAKAAGDRAVLIGRPRGLVR